MSAMQRKTAREPFDNWPADLSAADRASLEEGWQQLDALLSSAVPKADVADVVCAVQMNELANAMMVDQRRQRTLLVLASAAVIGCVMVASWQAYTRHRGAQLAAVKNTIDEHAPPADHTVALASSADPSVAWDDGWSEQMAVMRWRAWNAQQPLSASAVRVGIVKQRLDALEKDIDQNTL